MARVGIQGTSPSPTMRVIVPILVALLATSAAQECPEFYELVGSTCYLFADRLETWGDALTFCEVTAPPETTSTLAHLDDCLQHGLVWQHILNNYAIADYWIGGSDTLSEGVFRWDATGSVVDLEVPFWFPGQPDGGEAENALSLSKSGYFADENEDILQRFICQLL